MSEDTQVYQATPAEFAIVEIMGHRKRTGVIEDVERFGKRFLRVDFLDGDGQQQVEYYGPDAIFSMQIVSKAYVDQWERETLDYLQARAERQARFLPAPEDWDNDSDLDDRVTITEEGLAALRGQAQTEAQAEAEASEDYSGAQL